jgi:hypothetical protein
LSFLTEKLRFVSQKQTVWPQREAAQVMGWVLVAGSVFRSDTGTKVEDHPGEKAIFPFVLRKRS